MVIHWPAGITAKKEIRSQFSHVIDIAPTVYEACQIPAPRMVNGVQQDPIEGTSLVYTFTDAGAKEKHTVQYFEMFGNRGIYKDGWMARTIHRPAWNPKPSHPLADDVWELFDSRGDFSLSTDVASQNPDKLKELQAVYMEEAEKYHVLPIDDRLLERTDAKTAGRPTVMGDRTSVTFGEGMKGMGVDIFISTKNTSYSITSEVDVSAFRPSDDPFLVGMEYPNTWLATNNAEGRDDLVFESHIFPACPVTVRREYTWDGSYFTFNQAEYDVNPQPATLSLCRFLVDHAADLWGPQAAIQIMEPLLGDWPPETDENGEPYPADAKDEWRYRLGVYHALLGEIEAAREYFSGIVNQPSIPTSRYIEPAQAFLDAYQQPEDIYRANPPTGWIQNTNNWPFSVAGAASPRRDQYPRYMENGLENPRGIHAIRVLQGRTDFTLESLAIAAYDSYLTAFVDLVPVLVSGYDALPASHTQRAKLGGQIEMLGAWDYRWSEASTATTLAVFWGDELWRRIRADADSEDMPVYDYIAKRTTGEQRLEALLAASIQLERDFGTWRTPGPGGGQLSRRDQEAEACRGHR